MLSTVLFLSMLTSQTIQCFPFSPSVALLPQTYEQKLSILIEDKSEVGNFWMKIGSIENQ